MSGILSDPGVEWVEVDGKRVWQKPDVSGWMPIETAPKDGTSFLACNTKEGNFNGIFITAYRPKDVKGSGFGVIDSCCAYYEDAEPTHWMPLPAFPTP